MELKQIASKPTLQKVVVDRPFIVEAYGEPLEFYMWDRQSLPTFLRLAQLKDDQEQLFDILKDLVLDSDGKGVLSDGQMLPVDIMVPVLETAIEHLGNTTPQTSAQ